MNKQIKKWEEIYGKILTESDYEEIAINLNYFFYILSEWNEKNKPSIIENKNG